MKYIVMYVADWCPMGGNETSWKYFKTRTEAIEFAENKSKKKNFKIFGIYEKLSWNKN